jgi:hypothetical protein
VLTASSNIYGHWPGSRATSSEPDYKSYPRVFGASAFWLSLVAWGAGRAHNAILVASNCPAAAHFSQHSIQYSNSGNHTDICRMPPSFGWSVGDVLLGMNVVTNACRVFNSSRGAAVQFAETEKFLRRLELTLQLLHRYAVYSAQGSYTSEIVSHLQAIETPFNEFVAFVDGYKPALSEDSGVSNSSQTWGTVKWSLQELEKLSGRTAELKQAVDAELQLVHSLLFLQIL